MGDGHRGPDDTDWPLLPGEEALAPPEVFSPSTLALASTRGRRKMKGQKVYSSPEKKSDLSTEVQGLSVYVRKSKCAVSLMYVCRVRRYVVASNVSRSPLCRRVQLGREME